MKREGRAGQQSKGSRMSKGDHVAFSFNVNGGHSVLHTVCFWLLGFRKVPAIDVEA